MTYNVFGGTLNPTLLLQHNGNLNGRSHFLHTATVTPPGFSTFGKPVNVASVMFAGFNGSDIGGDIGEHGSVGRED